MLVACKNYTCTKLYLTANKAKPAHVLTCNFLNAIFQWPSTVLGSQTFALQLSQDKSFTFTTTQTQITLMLTQLKKFELAGVLLWSFIIVCFAFNEIALQSGKALISLSADGGKNYFTFLYHSLFESGVWFQGMNYPYGEHVVFTDAQPLLTFIFISCKKIIPSSGLNDALRIMHWSICLSFVLGILFNFKILTRFSVPFIAALILATCITFMSPHVFRISGHFALAYPSFSAMLFYFTLQYYYTEHWKYAFYIFLLGALMYFLHPYYLALCMVWVFFYTLSSVFSRNQKDRPFIAHHLPLWISVSGMWAVAKIFMYCTDPVKDRPVFPHGATAYGATGDEIFTSAYSPLWQYIKGKNWIKSINEGGEGFSYPGIICLIIIGFSVIRFLYLRRTKQKNTFESVGHLFPAQWRRMALFLLLFGMGVPFVWHMEWLLNYLSAFRQFRSLGRFITLFYQIITIFSAVILCSLLKKGSPLGKKYLKIIAISGILIWSFEASGYIRFIHKLGEDAGKNYKVRFENNDKSWSQFLNEHHYKISDFQAQLLLPYIHIGSEKWSLRGEQADIMALGYELALQTKIHIVDVMMSRTSWSQTASQVRVAGGVFADKPIFSLPDSKSFLILTEQHTTFSPDEQYLIENAVFIGQFKGLNVYKLSPSSINNFDKKENEKIKILARSMTTTDTAINLQNGFFLINHMDNLQKKEVFFGESALGLIGGNDTLLASLEVHPVSDMELYEISSWILLSKRDFRAPVLNLSMLDEQGNEIFRKDARGGESFDNKGMWFRVNLYFQLPANCRRLRWALYDNDKLTYLALDEVQIRPASSTIISKNEKGQIMVNNHLLKHSLQ